MGVKAQYGAAFWTLAVVATLFTFGFGLLLLLWLRTMWLDEANDQGVTTLSGRHFDWSQLSDVERTTITAGGARVAGVGGLLFGTKKVLINTALIKNDADVVAFVQNKIGAHVTG